MSQPPSKSAGQAVEPELPAPQGDDSSADLPDFPVPPETAFENSPELPLALDEGPRPGPVDAVQEAIFEAVQQGAATDVEVDDLPEPLPDLDEGPRPGPMDEVQEAIFEATREGASTDIEFDQLPEPGVAGPRKVIKFKTPPPAPEPSPIPEISPPAPETLPLPDFPAPAPPPPPGPEFWLILALFVAFRGLTLLLLRPGGFIRDWSDFDTYFGIAALSDYGLYPFWHFWLEWPPLVPWLAVGAYKLSLLLPPWPDDPRLWFILILGSAFVLFEIGNFWLIHRLARRLLTPAEAVNRVLWLYALLFPPVYAMLGFFDGVALFFILLALDWLLDDRRLPSAIAVGFGFMVKIIPVLILPVALRRIWQRYQADNREAGIEMGLYGVVFGLTVLALLLPFLLGGPQWVLTAGRAMLGRSSWETVWAVAEGYYGFGVVLGDRLNPAETGFAVHPATLPWGLISLGFAGLYALLWFRPADYRRPRPLVALTGLTLAVFTLYNKGYSPQFLVYLLPFILLLFPSGRGVVYALVFTGLNVLEQPVYFVLLPQATWLLTGLVVIRFVVTALLAIEFALEIWPPESPHPFWADIRRQIPAALGWSAGLGLLILMPVLFTTYSADRTRDNPAAIFTGFMQTRPPARLLLSDQATFRQVYPPLHQTFDLRLADGAAKFSGAPKIADLLAGQNRVWILPTGDSAPALRNAVERRGKTLAVFDFTGVGLAELVSFEANPAPFIAPGRFQGGLELLAHQLETKPHALEVTLYWRATSPQNQSYTVFTQLLNAEGQLVAGHDSLPANGAAPTEDWPVNAVQADFHRLDLPADLPPGEYTLIVGLYNRFNERLRGIGPDGFGFANRAMPLATVSLTGP